MLNLRSSKALCALALALSLTAFAGCGGDDDSSSSGGDAAQYKKEFRAARAELQKGAKAAAAEVKGATDTAGKVKALEGLKGVLTDSAEKFDALDPPKKVKADHDKLVPQFRGVFEGVDAVKKALESEDQAAARAATQRLQQAQTAVGKTLARIETKVGRSKGGG